MRDRGHESIALAVALKRKPIDLPRGRHEKGIPWVVPSSWQWDPRWAPKGIYGHFTIEDPNGQFALDGNMRRPQFLGPIDGVGFSDGLPIGILPVAGSTRCGSEESTVPKVGRVTFNGSSIHREREHGEQAP